MIMSNTKHAANEEERMVDVGPVVNWRDDPDAESVIGFIGVQWEKRTILLVNIDWDESANNCARMLNPLNEEKIEDYATCMTRGDAFPSIVVENTETGYVILGGNQRTSAVKRVNGKSADAYVLTGLTTSQRESLIRSLNARHGWGTSKEDRIDHAVYLVRAQGLSTDDAARLMVVSSSTILKRIRAENAKANLAKAGLDASKLSMTHMDALDRIQDGDIQLEVARIAVQKGVSADSIKNVVDSMHKARSRAGQISKMKEWSKDLLPAVDGKKTLKSPRREKFLRSLTLLNDFLERGNDGSGFSSLDELQCVEADSDKVKMLAAKVLIRLKTIAGV
jgi:hypothetical protein